ncbi:hypothetical protein K4F52_006851 [Lecanicillium sp. MT-2017a]|nr:hypothetical protein K4F52_006851 [Lecanicillium sp. MT-2017a]
MALETVSLEHVPSSHKVHVAMFKDVQNAAFLHEQLLARNADFEYALIDASVAVSRTQLLSAVFRAVTTAVNGALKTPNVHSEIVASLSASSNIAEAYRRFGISPSTKDLLVVKVTFPTGSQPEPTSSDTIWKHLQANVQGTPLPVTDDNIVSATDLTKVRKYYKLNGLDWFDRIADGKHRQKELEGLVVASMALRGV